VKRVISVIGAGTCTRREYNLAHEVGRRLAERGFAVACGGLLGVMEAACMGAKEADGLTIGLLPGTAREDANRYVDLSLPTGLRDARNAIVATCAEAVIAVGGKLGTLSEIALAIKRGIPVVGLYTWKLDPDRLIDTRVPAAKTAEEAVDLAIELADRRERERQAGVPASADPDDADA
jgi:uncharacterized protein (TIGR00725 family)